MLYDEDRRKQRPSSSSALALGSVVHRRIVVALRVRHVVAVMHRLAAAVVGSGYN